MSEVVAGLRVEGHPLDPDVFQVYKWVWPEKSGAPLVKRAVFRVGRSPNLNLVSTAVKLDHGPWVDTIPKKTLDKDMVRAAEKHAQKLTGIQWWRVVAR